MGLEECKMKAKDAWLCKWLGFETSLSHICVRFAELTTFGNESLEVMTTSCACGP